MDDRREPAFARRLLRRRWGGDVLHRVGVVFGGEWTSPRGCDEFVALSSRHWTPDSTDWRCLTDLRVVVLDRDDKAKLVDGWPLCVWVAAEIADHAAVVHIDTPRAIYEEVVPLVDIQRLAWDLIEQNGAHPSWWPAQRSLTHDQRRERFLDLERARRGWTAADVRSGVRG